MCQFQLLGQIYTLAEVLFKKKSNIKDALILRCKTTMIFFTVYKLFFL